MSELLLLIIKLKHKTDVWNMCLPRGEAPWKHKQKPMILIRFPLLHSVWVNNQVTCSNPFSWWRKVHLFNNGWNVIAWDQRLLSFFRTCSVCSMTDWLSSLFVLFKLTGNPNYPMKLSNFTQQNTLSVTLAKQFLAAPIYEIQIVQNQLPSVQQR